MEIKLRVLRTIQKAVQSITSCTDPVIQMNGVCAIANGLRSPYAEHKTVSWEVAETRPGELIASSNRYSLVIKTYYAQDTLPEAYSIGGFVGAWEGGHVPTHIVQPVLDLAENFGLSLYGSEARLVRAYVLLPKLAAYHLGRPVFSLADRNNKPLEIGDYVDEPVTKIAGVSLIPRKASRWKDDFHSLEYIPMWAIGNRVGPVIRDDGSGEYDFHRSGVASVVAARNRGETIFLVSLNGPALLASGDERVTIDGEYIAIAPSNWISLANEEEEEEELV